MTKLLTKMTLMINRFYFLTRCCVLLFLSQNTVAQSWDLVTKVDAHQVVVRWVPLDPASWVEGNEKGFQITIRYQGEKTILKTVEVRPQGPDYFISQHDSLPKADLMAGLLEQVPRSTGTDLDILFGLVMVHSTIHPKMGSGLGMRWVDVPPVGVKKITYQLAYPHGKVLTEKTIRLDQITTLYRPLDLKVQQQDSLFTFRWLPGDSLLNWAYRLEISEDGEKWRPVDDLLILPAVDEFRNEYLAKEYRIPKFYKPYFFRVLAYTPFGEMSIPSRRIQVTGHRQRFPALEPTIQTTQRGIQYQWNFPDSLTAEIKGFKVYSSRKIDHEGQTIAFLSPQTRAWLDTAAVLDSYSHIALVDWGGGEHRSSRLFITWPDSIPPADVKGLVARVSAEGIVRLSWPKVSAPDFLGYRVFRSDSPKADFVLLTTEICQDSTWTDTLSLALLNSKVYYTLRAFDTRLNGSVSNDTLLVIRPDHIPPAALSIRSFQQSEESVLLQWNPSSSSDVAWVQILRQSSSDSLPCLLVLFENDFPTEWIDSTGEEGTTYQYSLMAIDQVGLSSLPVSIQLGRIFTGVRPALSGLNVHERVDVGAVEISWEIPLRPVRSYQVYRQGPNDTFLVPYRKLDGKYGVFEDVGLMAGQRYHYLIQALYQDGSVSRLDEREKIELVWRENE